MTRPTTAFLAAFLLLYYTYGTNVAAEDDGFEKTYRIQPGDILEISVWREEDLLRTVLVRPDGGLSFPLVGDVQASGKTIPELQEMVTERLTKYIPDPVVTVSTQQLSGNKVYVIGKVAQPGEFVANRYMDIVQALSVAGGMTPYASANKIKVLRRNNGKLMSIPFRYGDIEKGEDLEQNIILQSGDVVLVP
ncbi:MAG TPA: polysaccharide biosynthesis/export family protein [Gammaproteobacteria bacterium]|nr:polysaccharide biosynthesis/export family protein [Gammaproteobacteria bacterium]